MNLRMDLKKRVIELLSTNIGKKFKARDIARWIVETYPEAAAEKMRRSKNLENRDQLLNQIVAEIGANRPLWERDIPELRTTEGIRPRQFFWSVKSEADEVKEAEEHGSVIAGPEVSGREVDSGTGGETSPASYGGQSKRISEADLYPVLMRFIEDEYAARGFRIDDKKSSNSYGAGANRWLFPDVVAMEDLADGMHDEVVTAIRSSGHRQLRLWSFEVKLLVNRSNARETYFQTISNSSWAHVGYLVASKFEGTDTLKELRILYAVHGIGIIRLDVENPSESEVLVPARERPEVEWAMCSRLASENNDFRQFVRRVRQFYQTGDIPPR